MSDGPEVEYALKQGGDAYMAKPFTLKDLVARLEQMQELTLRIAHKHEDTGLPGAEAIQKEIDHRIFRRLPFSLCYASVDNLEPLMLQGGREAGVKLITWMGEILRKAIRDCKLYETFLSHLGREHFLVLLDVDAFEDYCNGVTSSFDLGISQFYKDFDVQDGYIVATKRPGTYAGYRLTSLRIDVTVWKPGESSFVNAHELFHELKEAHKKSQGGEHKALFRWDQYKKW
jgi:GGDEF domain-containing protein